MTETFLLQRTPRAGFSARLTRALRYHLVLPMLRARQPAYYISRGTMIGIVCSLMPVIGQTLVVLLLWLIATRFLRWRFSLIIAVVWTWISNPLTSPFIFYGLYVTGQVLLGRWHDLSGFTSFTALVRGLFTDDLSFGEQAGRVLELIFLDWGLALWVGYLPWATLFGWLGYRWSLRLIEAYHHMRARRIARRRGTHAL